MTINGINIDEEVITRTNRMALLGKDDAFSFSLDEGKIVIFAGLVYCNVETVCDVHMDTYKRYNVECSNVYVDTDLTDIAMVGADNMYINTNHIEQFKLLIREHRIEDRSFINMRREIVINRDIKYAVYDMTLAGDNMFHMNNHIIYGDTDISLYNKYTNGYMNIFIADGDIGVVVDYKDIFGNIKHIIDKLCKLDILHRGGLPSEFGSSVGFHYMDKSYGVNSNMLRAFN